MMGRGSSRTAASLVVQRRRCGVGDLVFEVSIPLDADGFLDRQCHSANCNRYFKVLHADWEMAVTNVVTCPFCGFEDEPSNFTTVEQQDFVHQSAMALA